MKSIVLAVGFLVVGEEESVLKESKAAVEICGFSSSTLPAAVWLDSMAGGKRNRDSVSMILNMFLIDLGYFQNLVIWVLKKNEQRCQRLNLYRRFQEGIIFLMNLRLM